MKKAVVICLAIGVLVLALACNNDPPLTNGNLVISLYCQTIQDDLTAQSISLEEWVTNNDVQLASLVRIEGLVPEYYIGDEYGRIRVSDVPPGTYTIHPMFMSNDHDIEVTIVAGENLTRTVIMPNVVIQGFLVHADFMNADFRRALSIGINRENILTELAWDYSPAYTALPACFYQDDLYTDTGITESSASAVELFGSGSAQDFELKFNTTDENTHAALASEVSAQWEAYDAVNVVTLSEAAWDSFIVDVYEDHDYQLARFGWGFDSNNPLVFFKEIFDRTDYSSEAYSALVSELEAAQADMDAETFLALVDEFHTLILEEGLFIPVYER